jgi:nucleoside-diphosphate-sugar epimerase
MTTKNQDKAASHLVLGTGPLGRATATALANRGNNVILLNRSGKLGDRPVGSRVIAGDLVNPRALASALPEVAAVYFCVQPPYHKWPAEFPALQSAAVAVAQAMDARLIVAENLYGYGLVTGPMTEDMPLRPNTRKGGVRAAMHGALMQLHDSGDLRVAVARSSDFFGPFVDGSAAGARAMNAVVAGKAVEYVGDLDAAHSYTFVEDFGAALATLGTDDRSLGQVWHVPNAPTVSSRMFFETAFGIAGKQPKFRKMGAVEMKALGLFIAPLREMVEMIYEFDSPFVVDDSKFKAAFGDIATPLRDALSRTIHWTQKR